MQPKFVQQIFDRKIFWEDFDGQGQGEVRVGNVPCKNKTAIFLWAGGIPFFTLNSSNCLKALKGCYVLDGFDVEYIFCFV